MIMIIIMRALQGAGGAGIFSIVFITVCMTECEVYVHFGF
jgi:hypothetical protein